MKMSTKQLAAVALAAAALTAAGCGSSEKAATSSTATTAASQPGQSTGAGQTKPVGSDEEITVSSGVPLSRKAWIAKGDAICGRTNAKLSTTTASSPRDFGRLLPQAAGYERAEATELAALVPPRSTANDWQHIVSNLQKSTAAERAEAAILAITKRDGFKTCSLP
jgi:hypothetical protein